MVGFIKSKLKPHFRFKKKKIPALVLRYVKEGVSVPNQEYKFYIISVIRKEVIGREIKARNTR